MSELKKQTITIFDDHYTIISDEPDELFAQAVEYTNKLMASISVQSGIVDKKKIAVLSTLQMAVQIRKLEHQLNSWRQKEEELVASVNRHLDTVCSS